MHSCKAEDYYTDVIAPPPQRKVSTSKHLIHQSTSSLNEFSFISIEQTVSNRENEVQTEDEQQFLSRQQQVLMQGQNQTRGESPMRTPPSTSKTMQRASVRSSY